MLLTRLVFWSNQSHVMAYRRGESIGGARSKNVSFRWLVRVPRRRGSSWHQICGQRDQLSCGLQTVVHFVAEESVVFVRDLLVDATTQ